MDNITKERIGKMLPNLNEKEKRRYLAIEAKGLGRGGIAEIIKLTGVSRNTIKLGFAEIESNATENKNRIRKEGGGRKKIVDTQVEIVLALEKQLESSTIGNPENPLKWTAKSLRNLAKELQKEGFVVGHVTIGEILKGLGYSLQMNKKSLQVGIPHPDRNAQFEYINEQAKSFINANEPVISVDTKKKEMIGNFKNNGAEYAKKNQSTKVLDHDFMLPELGKVNPYGVYDINNNLGFVNLGISSDTAEFAVESIHRWWMSMGVELYPNATKLYITCDGGGSNGSRLKLWKTTLQELANKTKLDIYVSHFPPGTSKWNKIEHRLFSYISKNWRARPLVSIEVTISLIASTTTENGLKVKCILDENIYKKGLKVSDELLSSVAINKDAFHGEWNYFITSNT
jgi:transposase